MPLENQHKNFAFEVLPLLFHNETSKFFVFLKRDGNEFLKFWWERAGLHLKENMRDPAEGLDHEIRTYSDGREVVLVKLPTPRIAPEAYFLALVARPKKRSVLPWRNLARVFALSRAVEETGELTTVIAELTRSARYVPIKKGPKPTLKAFYKIVTDILDKKPKLGWL